MSDAPLVSIIVRSADRACLPEAIASICAQTHTAIEIVVVNATAHRHSAVTLPASDVPRGLRMVNAEGGQLDRAEAANAGLNAARGFYLGFLDDDDLLLPEHVSKLVTALTAHADYKVAYSGVSVEDAPGHSAGLFDEDFDAAHLLAGNFLPIHAVLFQRDLLARGCRFDPRLALFEDWDFWLQLARHGDFLHVAGTSAIYRRWLGTSDNLGQSRLTLREQNLAQLYAKWQAITPADAWGAAWVDVRRQLDGCYAREAGLRRELDDIRSRLSAEAHAQAKALAEARAELERILRSRSWRLTAALRSANGYLRRLFDA